MANENEKKFIKSRKSFLELGKQLECEFWYSFQIYNRSEKFYFFPIILTAKSWHAILMFWENVIIHSVCHAQTFILANHVPHVV